MVAVAAWRPLLWLALLALALPAPAQTTAASAEEIKAAYLVRFIGYVEWPPRAFPAADTPVVIGLSGAHEMRADLLALTRGRSAAGRPVVVREIAPGGPLDGVHLLYIARGMIVPRSWIGAARENAVLVVMDGPEGLADGAVLNFRLDDDRVRFEASLPAAESSGLKLSSRLLAVAARVVVDR
jgi:hypothetical protein